MTSTDTELDVDGVVAEVANELGCCDDQVCGNTQRADCAYHETARRIVARLSPTLSRLKRERDEAREALTHLYITADEVCDDVSPNSEGALRASSDCAVQAHLILALRSCVEHARSTLSPKESEG